MSNDMTEAESTSTASGAGLPVTGVTDDELQTAIKVVDHFATHPDEYDQRQNRPFRRALRRIFRREQAKYFDGLTVEQYVANRVRKAVEHRVLDHDRGRINKTRLRERRAAKAKLVIEQNKLKLACLVRPDGPVHTTNTPTPVTSPCEQQLYRALRCYICKRLYNRLHHFYDQLCPDCAAVNWTKRRATADLTGKVALVTGGRIKIGFEVCVRLLRAGATVHATSRFAFDAAQRYAQQTDFDQWSHRLHIHALDFRQISRVEQFCVEMVSALPRLDVIVNNACQTVRRPASHYSHLLDLRPDECATLPDRTRQLVRTVTKTTAVTHNQTAKPPVPISAEQSQVALLPEDTTERVLTDNEGDGRPLLDVHGQAIDARTTNSWVLRLEQVSTVEAAEVLAINALAPFVINARLKPLLLKGKTAAEPKFIVNVSAMEGKFSRFKTPFHPHTNMAKAALNMLTRTSADDYARQGIYMTSVDTGWINDEAPAATAAQRNRTFTPPLDEVDAAARVLDPVVLGCRDGQYLYGVFLKDYQPTDW